MENITKPFIIKLDNDIENNNLELDDHIDFSSNINLPLCSLGFQNFLVRTKNAMNITKNLETKNEFYYVVNPFEINISNYEDTLTNLTKIYLNIDILDRTFYIIWEILFLFELIDDEKDLTFAIISGNSNGIIQAIINYRKKFINLKNVKDKIFNISDEEILISSKIIKNHKSKEDITHIQTINAFKKEIDKSKKYANVLIADCGYDNESIIYHILLGEIITALKVQEYKGHFILKIYETFTYPTIKLIYIISSFYEEAYIYKPYYSRPDSSEKFLILKNFKYNKDSKIVNDNSKILENILEKIKNNDNYIYNIFSKINLSISYLNKFIFINIKIANIQQIIINNIVKYIKENNYFGDRYHSYKNEQIKSTQFWILNFFPPNENLYKKNKEDLIKQLNFNKETFNMESNKFTSILIPNIF